MRFAQQLFVVLDAQIGVAVVDVVHILHRRLEAELFGGQPDHFSIWFGRCLAEIAEHHPSVAVDDLFPWALYRVGESLLEIELRNRRDRSAETALGHHFAHVADHLREKMERIVIPHHLRIRCQGSTRHGRERNDRIDLFGFRGHIVLVHVLDEHRLDLQVLLLVDIKREIGSAQAVPHSENVDFGRAAADRGHGEVDDVDACLYGCIIAGNAHACGIVCVELEHGACRQHRPRAFDRFIDDGRGRGAGSVLEGYAVERNARIKDLPELVEVEARGVAV